MRVEVVAGGPARLAERSSTWLADRLWAAVAERGAAHLAVSGGNTPSGMFVALATLPIPWEHIHLWQVDERVAPDGDEARNATSLSQHLVSRVPIAPDRVHLMDVAAPDLDAAADAYAEAMRDSCGAVLDIVHLGLGDDGHTASWPPGDAIVDVEDRDVALAGLFNGYRRMTLTVPAVNRARHIMFLVGWRGEGARRASTARRRYHDPRLARAQARRDTARRRGGRRDDAQRQRVT